MSAQWSQEGRGGDPHESFGKNRGKEVREKGPSQNI